MLEQHKVPVMWEESQCALGQGGQNHRVLTLWKVAITPGRTGGGKCLHLLSSLTSPWFLRMFCGSNDPLGPEMMTHQELNCLPCH